MTGKATDHVQDRLALRARFSEIAQLSRWTESLASRHSISANVLFAVDVCLEEVVSNIIRHGYGGETNRPVIVHFTMPRQGEFLFVVEDEAPAFNPLDQSEMPALNTNEEIWIGGQGIRLLREFADHFEYEATPTGNRLSMSFSAATSM